MYYYIEYFGTRDQLWEFQFNKIIIKLDEIIIGWTCIAFSGKKQLPWSVRRKLLVPFQQEEKRIIGCKK